jgi:kynurenine formamidase
MKHGYVERVGNAYRVTDKVNIPELQKKLQQCTATVERGVSLIEALWLEDLSKDGVYEFLFIASPLKFRGGTASPIRPLAISLQH